jgi:hypothetical protein
MHLASGARLDPLAAKRTLDERKPFAGGATIP